jgi:hypothetical protein
MARYIKLSRIARLSFLQLAEEAMENYNYDSFRQCEGGAPDFRSVAQIGSRAPDFTLSDLDGNQVSLSLFRTMKHVLLESAASPDRHLWGRFLH